MHTGMKYQLFQFIYSLVFVLSRAAFPFRDALDKSCIYLLRCKNSCWGFRGGLVAIPFLASLNDSYSSLKLQLKLLDIDTTCWIRFFTSYLDTTMSAWIQHCYIYKLNFNRSSLSLNCHTVNVKRKHYDTTLSATIFTSYLDMMVSAWIHHCLLGLTHHFHLTKIMTSLIV